MFNKTDYNFIGKHGECVSKLTSVIDGSRNFSIFQRNIDVLFIAPIVGYLYNRLEDRDINNPDNDENKKINFQQLSTNKDILNFNYSLIMLLHDKSKVDLDERINRAFRYADGTSEKEECEKIYEKYILGGISVLKEKLLDNATTVDDYMSNMYSFISECNDRMENDNIDLDLNKLFEN